MHFTKAKQSNLFYCISFGTSQRGFTYIERGYCREGFGCMSKMSTLSFKMDLNSFTDYLLSTSRLKASDKIKFMVRNTRAVCSCDFSAQSSFSISKIGNDWLRTQVLRSQELPRCELHQSLAGTRAVVVAQLVVRQSKLTQEDLSQSLTLFWQTFFLCKLLKSHSHCFKWTNT